MTSQNINDYYRCIVVIQDETKTIYSLLQMFMLLISHKSDATSCRSDDVIQEMTFAKY